MDDRIKAGIERNADLIVIVSFAIVDYGITGMALSQSIDTWSAIDTGQFPIRKYRLFIDLQTFASFIIAKSILLYMTAFLVARRLGE